MPSRLKFSIGPVMHVQPCWQTCRITGPDSAVQRPIPLTQPLMQAAQRSAHAPPRQRVPVMGLGMLEKLGHIRGRDGVVLEARFEPLQPECCQHQQPRNKSSEQPRHKGEVNTAKVSAGSRNVTGPHRSAPGESDPLSRLAPVTVGETSAGEPAAAKPARRATSRKWDNETRIGLVRRARRMNRTLAQAFPHVYCELDFTNPLELTVATILSAQSTDKGVNLTTSALFKRYRTALDYAKADRIELEELIRPTGFYRNKANSLIRLGQELVERFDGKVPNSMDELVTLPGVGRKTANVILGNAFDIPGITVDTHFGRLGGRWRWTAEEEPVKVEHAIGELIERTEGTLPSHRLIFPPPPVSHPKKPPPPA